MRIPLVDDCSLHLEGAELHFDRLNRQDPPAPSQAPRASVSLLLDKDEHLEPPAVELLAATVQELLHKEEALSASSGSVCFLPTELKELPGGASHHISKTPPSKPYTGPTTSTCL